MLRSAASKVMWVGRATVFLVGLAVIIALTVGVVSQASAQNRPAQNVFMLGATNTVNAMSSLVGSVANSAMLLVDNNGGGPALDLQVEPGQAPMKVNSGAKVDSLNADKLDGKSDTDFYAAGSKVADSDKLDGKDSGDFLKDTVTVVAYGHAYAESSGTATASCPAGYEAVGGGVDPENASSMRITSSGPIINGSRTLLTPDGQNPAATGWRASLSNNDTWLNEFKIAVICARS